LGWWSLGAAGLLLVVVHALGGLARADDAAFLVLGTLALAAVAAGTRLHRPVVRWPWGLAAGAIVLFLVGGSMRAALGTLGDVTESRPLGPDVVTLGGYVL